MRIAGKRKKNIGSVHQLLEEGSTCWRIARAGRASLLVDGSNYFSAVRAAMLKAEKSIYIIGWDIDSRVRLAPQRNPDEDPAPDKLGALLTWIAKHKPRIRIHLLLWDYSVLYALEREPLPKLNLDWRTPRQIKVCLDDALPLGASHHQKIVVVDDAVVFCGGLDLTIRRWDTPDHEPSKTERVDHAGVPYGPFHDMQMLVDGDAARALAEVVRERWRAATCVATDPVSPHGDPWPDSVHPDLRDVDVGISRTLPPTYEREAVREVEQLFRRTIERAERYLYIENQYVTSVAIADMLADRLKKQPDLRCIIVSARDPGGWIEARTMMAGRARFMRRLEQAGVADRVFLRHPVVSEGARATAVMVHAKLMIIDDRFVRVGSANLNNRSMGMDTECDLSIEATNDEQRKRIIEIRNRTLGEHLGLDPAEVSDIFDSPNFSWASLLATSRGGHKLKRIEDDDLHDDELSRMLTEVADPERPIVEAVDIVGDMFHAEPARQPMGRHVKLVVTGIALLALILIWQFTPLAALTDPETLKPWFDSVAQSQWVYLLVPLIYVAGGLVVFPITVLIALTAMAFGPWVGFLLAIGGSLLSSVVSYQVGALAGRGFLSDLMGKHIMRISKALGRRGLVSVVAMRLVPIAPFSFINFVAGASHIGLRDFVMGTVIGMAPGIAIMTVLGDRIRRLWEDPSGSNVAMVTLAIFAWIGFSFLLHRLVSRLKGRRER